MSDFKEDYSKPSEVKAYAAMEAKGPLQPHTITRRGVTADDVLIDIKFAGICHSDIHTAKDEWGPAIYPLVPGHEIIGLVVAVGSNVTEFEVGASVGVGCMVDSCRSCGCCKKGLEQYCSSGSVYTYNSRHKYKHCAEYVEETGGNPTYGGYSQKIVVDKRFVVGVPETLDMAAATPLLCAGITMYSPMIQYGLQAKHRFGVIGLGGLGHMGAKFGVAFGCHTTVISRGETKRASALNDLKVHSYLNSQDAEAMKAAKGTFDFLICTVSAGYDLADYTSLLDVDGKIILVGAPPNPLGLKAGNLIGKRITVAGSLIGGVQETQEMMDFCGRHNIVCDIELIAASQINVAYERTLASDVKYRFVIDTSTM